MMLCSSIEGSTSHSGRKKSACVKVLYFTIWNVFFVNVFSGSVISQLNVISSPKDIPTQLAIAVPSYFITYVPTSGWASLSSEIMQLFGLVWNFIRRRILRWKDDPISVPSFPYHTEVPKVLLFGLLGFTCSILAPLILPFLLIYFFLSYVVYRNQIVHTTLLPIFKKFSAEDLMQMDKEDELFWKMEEILEQLPSAYCQFPDDTQELDIEVFQGENAAVQVDGESSSNDAKCDFSTVMCLDSRMQAKTSRYVPNFYGLNVG
ncbi:hypothetical protein HPP92_028668 [Vanilla planifolia]|uniref:CSC1/OSCA1-like 7TM region domain-containing protein n=1 Tax=Vanilla planifolia TaxID=51239 RepID=A0A835U276_VANPL|nr:hypothetical protein HPP92_028668 [Vanilla planifolia]